MIYGDGGYNNCITGNVPFFEGHAWVVDGWKPGNGRKAMDTLTDEERDFSGQCVGTQAPELYSIEGTWFRVNDTVPADVVEEIESLWQEESSTSLAKGAIPQHLLAYVTEPGPEEINE